MLGYLSHSAVIPPPELLLGNRIYYLGPPSREDRKSVPFFVLYFSIGEPFPKKVGKRVLQGDPVEVPNKEMEGIPGANLPSFLWFSGSA